MAWTQMDMRSPPSFASEREPFKTHLIAAHAVFGKLLIVAGAAVDVAAFGQEALGAYWPLAAVTGETVIVPRGSFVLNSLRACKKIPDGPDGMNDEVGEICCASARRPLPGSGWECWHGDCPA